MLPARSNDPDQIRTACDWAEEWVHALDGTGRELAHLHATRLQVACLWAAGRTDETHTALRSVAALCARHNLIRFLPDDGPRHRSRHRPDRVSGRRTRPATVVRRRSSCGARVDRRPVAGYTTPASR